MTKKSLYISRVALIAALYAVLTLPLGPLAYMPFIQVRPAEALTLLPLLMPSSVFGVTIGCMIVNVFGGGILDVIIGGGITLVACFLTKLVKNPFLGGIFPVLLNAIFLPIMFKLVGNEVGYFYTFLQILLSQTIWVYGLGLPLYFTLKKYNEKGRIALY